ncbi:hypothetical protein BU23DRAFT_229360 [Bimuria novae-zelandiae CBS 107.79]|uniref:DUF7137 domain-containing protein n=1 Tax=Bimuria novae-zelandiae CBS 107.79 TaxID=1447943 RepID=A0A6A5VMV2_9PLEO|nr:hypothetical protein BU23DRAFT_229360 [Bimuria novae-zelandiae CBS 107.79]
MRPSQLLAAVVALSATAASSNVFDNINALGEAKHMFIARQNDEQPTRSATREAATTESPKETGKASGSSTPTPTKDDDSKTTGKDASGTGKGDASSTGKGDSSGTGKGDSSGTGKATKTTGKPKVTNFGPDVQPGGIQMVTPSPLMGPQYYKVGDWVTFAWNYTSVSVMPDKVDVLASCSVNQGTYTIAVDHPAKATEVLWDTKSYKEKNPNGPDFVSEMYTLIIYDSNRTATEVPRPGYMAPFNQFYFGMYTPQLYKKWEDWECPNCLKNDALSLLASPTTRVIFLTFGTTLASFFYFANAFGLW